jgi:hypothetical protein
MGRDYRKSGRRRKPPPCPRPPGEDVSGRTGRRRAGYGATWKRVEAFRVALRQSQRPLPFKARDLPGNSAGKLDIANLLATSLPDPAHLLREDDLAGDDEV